MATCGGSLITSFAVLTSASCVCTDLPVTVDVQLGSTSFDNYSVSSILCHPDFNSTTRAHDLAVLTLSTTASSHSPVPLDTGGGTAGTPGTTAVVVGWGSQPTISSTTSDYVLPAHAGGKIADLAGVMQQATVDVLDPRLCALNRSSSAPPMPDGALCAGTLQGSVELCAGDGGDALLGTNINGYPSHLVGVASYAFGCGKGQMPARYTRVSEHLSWLLANVFGLANSVAVQRNESAAFQYIIAGNNACAAASMASSARGGKPPRPLELDCGSQVINGITVLVWSSERSWGGSCTPPAGSTQCAALVTTANALNKCCLGNNFCIANLSATAAAGSSCATTATALYVTASCGYKPANTLGDSGASDAQLLAACAGYHLRSPPPALRPPPPRPPPPKPPSPPPAPPVLSAQEFACATPGRVCAALAAFYFATSGPTSWINTEGWALAAAGIATDACTFVGVGCAQPIKLLTSGEDYALSTTTSVSSGGNYANSVTSL